MAYSRNNTIVDDMFLSLISANTAPYLLGLVTTAIRSARVRFRVCQYPRGPTLVCGPADLRTSPQWFKYFAKIVAFRFERKRELGKLGDFGL